MSSWTYLIWCEGRWFDLDLNWRKIPTLILKSRNELGFLGSKDALLDLEMTLYFDSVNRVFLSKFLSPIFSYRKPLFTGNLIAFDLEFSLNIYWELIMNLIWYFI